MEVERNSKSIAEDVQAGIGSVRVLLGTIEDKIRFYFRDVTYSGPYWELVQHHALALQTLLGVTDGILYEIAQDQDVLVSMLHGAAKEAAHE